VTTIAVVPAGGKAPQGMIAFEDVRGTFAKTYDAKPGSTWLIRPDQHVTARWRSFDAAAIRAGLARATCNA